MTYKVIVVGGGIIGTSTAYFLSKLGVSVTLIEENDIASGTTGACDQGVLLQTKKPGPVLELAKESSQIYRNLEHELPLDIEYKRGGGMILIESELEYEMVQQHISRLREAHVDAHMLSREEALELQSGFSPSVLASTWCEDDASVNSMRVSLAMVEGAKRLGAKIRLGEKVTGLLIEKEQVKGVKLLKDTIFADAVVLATGIWTRELMKPHGVDIPIIPRRGQILVTEKIPPFLTPHIISGPYIAAKGTSGSRVQSDQSAGVGLVVGQTKSGNLLIGGSREFVGFNRRTTKEVTSAIGQAAVRVFPELAKVRIVRTFAGLRPYTPDSMPILGPVESLPGLFIAAGHEGDGIALAPVTGKLMAQIVCEITPEVDLSPFSLNRFLNRESAHEEEVSTL